MRKGRSEKNRPSLGSRELPGLVMEVMKAHGASPGPDGFWALYRDLMLVLPAASAASGLPCSVSGVGRVGGRGRKARLRWCRRVEEVSDGLGAGGSFEDRFWSAMLGMGACWGRPSALDASDKLEVRA